MYATLFCDCLRMLYLWFNDKRIQSNCNPKLRVTIETDVYARSMWIEKENDRMTHKSNNSNLVTVCCS